jgi:hypothetical protein
MARSITLMGGLGNQLFQYARALEFDEKVNLVDFVAPNRRGANSLPDLMEFKLSPNVKLASPQDSPLKQSKVLNYCVRLSSQNERKSLTRFCAKLIIVIQSSASERRFVSFEVAQGLDDLCKESSAECFIGYFQNHVIAKRLRAKGLELIFDSKVLEKYVAQSNKEQPLIVHYRLTDYLYEENFGVPSIDYYEEGIKLLWEQGDYKRIWVFSDDIARARQLFPRQFEQHAVFISEPEASTAEIFQIMRLGHGYVIANSSYSWWAASLARETNVKVISPEPWFSGSDNPKKITPPDWVTLPKNSKLS